MKIFKMSPLKLTQKAGYCGGQLSTLSTHVSTLSTHVQMYIKILGENFVMV